MKYVRYTNVYIKHIFHHVLILHQLIHVILIQLIQLFYQNLPLAILRHLIFMLQLLDMIHSVQLFKLLLHPRQMDLHYHLFQYERFLFILLFLNNFNSFYHVINHDQSFCQFYQFFQNIFLNNFLIIKDFPLNRITFQNL